MEHEQALTSKAPARYLLNEMSEPDRSAFEAHFFECEDCAEDVRTGELLAGGVQAIGGELPAALRSEKTVERHSIWDWLLRPATFAPAVAMAAAAFVAGYQALVTIPSLRAASQTQVVETAVLHAAARGDETVVPVNSKASATILMLDVNTGEPGQALQWNLQSPDGLSVGSGNTTVPPAGGQLPILAPNSQLNRPGVWILFLRTPAGAKSGSYPFRIVLK